jgi:peptidyl-prolyl cis-trans isomerase SurA
MSVFQMMRNANRHQSKRAALLLSMLLAGHAVAQTATPAAPAAAAPAAKPAPAVAKPSGGFLPPAASNANVIDSIAVVVNDEVITRNEIAARIKTIEADMKARNAPMPDAANLKRQVVESMIVQRAQVQLAKEMGVRVDDQMLDRAMGRIAEQQKMTVQQFRNELEKTGASFAAFREEIRTEIMMQRLREHEVDSKIQISEAEVDTHLAAEQAAATEQLEVNLSQILVRIPENASPEQIAARKARADEVSRQLRTGGDFAKIAATYSDASDALKGGEIGWRPADRIPPVFTEALAQLKPGQVTPVIKTAVGFYILKLADRRTAAENKEKDVVVQTHARHILLNVTPTQTAEQAKKKLAELKERLANGAKFEELARLFSVDGSASKGGDLGWLYPGDVVPEIETVMTNLKPGEVSDVVQSQYGFHLVEVLERKSDDKSKERVRNAARQAIHARKLEEATEDWARQVRDRAYVEFRDEQ